MEINNLPLKKYYSCYFDVLGTKNKSIKTAIRDMWIMSHCLAKQAWKNSEIIKRSFSDNYIISCDIDMGISGFEDILQCIGYAYCVALIDNNVLIRGAIVKGELFFSEESVLGPSLLEAYYLEDNVSIYPRIVVSNSIAVKASTNYSDLFIVDDDGCVFLNCLKYINQNFLKIRFNNLVNELKKQKELLTSKNLIKEANKISWLLNYLFEYYASNFIEK